MNLDELVKQKEALAAPVVVEKHLRKPVDQMMFKVLVSSVDGDKVKINLPMSLVKAGVKIGMGMPQVGSNDALKNIDLDSLIYMVDQGVMGKLVEIESADGDHVEIFVE